MEKLPNSNQIGNELAIKLLSTFFNSKTFLHSNKHQLRTLIPIVQHGLNMYLKATSELETNAELKNSSTESNMKGKNLFFNKVKNEYPNFLNKPVLSRHTIKKKTTRNNISQSNNEKNLNNRYHTKANSMSSINKCIVEEIRKSFRNMFNGKINIHIKLDKNILNNEGKAFKSFKSYNTRKEQCCNIDFDFANTISSPYDKLKKFENLKIKNPKLYYKSQPTLFMSSSLPAALYLHKLSNTCNHPIDLEFAIRNYLNRMDRTNIIQNNLQNSAYDLSKCNTKFVYPTVQPILPGVIRNDFSGKFKFYNKENFLLIPFQQETQNLKITKKVLPLLHQKSIVNQNFKKN